MQNTVRHSGIRSISKSAGALILVAALVGCGGDNNSAPGNVADVVLPVSLKEIKVALVNKVSDPFWTGTWNSPQTEQDWREIEHLAFQIELGGRLIKYAGTGARDRELISNPDWQQMAEQLSQDGTRAVNAVRSRNRELMDRAGPQLIETCDACHRAFKPDVPAMSEYAALRVALPPVSL